MTAKQEALFIFTRFPTPGKTKTRLIPLLGEQGAANLQKQMTEHLLHQLQELKLITLQVHFSGGTSRDMCNWLGSELTCTHQGSGDLGQRLLLAFQQGFTAGIQRIVVIGSDCPSLSNAQVTEAFSLLQSYDVVIGPATDGGYYLIGLSQPQPRLFENVPWGSDRVFSTTQAIAHQQNLTIAFLTPLSDIDRPEDMPVWHQAIAQKSAKRNAKKTPPANPVTDNTQVANGNGFD